MKMTEPFCEMSLSTGCSRKMRRSTWIENGLWAFYLVFQFGSLSHVVGALTDTRASRPIPLDDQSLQNNEPATPQSEIEILKIGIDSVHSSPQLAVNPQNSMAGCNLFCESSQIG
jgi:hypothetical protein